MVGVVEFILEKAEGSPAGLCIHDTEHDNYPRRYLTRKAHLAISCQCFDLIQRYVLVSIHPSIRVYLSALDRSPAWGGAHAHLGNIEPPGYLTSMFRD